MKTNSQSGQSLIETIIAIFILTMALTTALGLAIYALSSAAVSRNSVIASNLAREGVEVVRMMRDSNWLAAEVSTDPNYTLQACPDVGGRLCYPQAFIGPTYNVANSGAGGTFRAKFDSTNNTWSLDSSTAYDLYLQSGGQYNHTATATPPVFTRKVVISLSLAGGVYTAQNPQMRVQSIVGWRAKGCIDMVASDPSTTNCKIVIEEYMTNWKDY